MRERVMPPDALDSPVTPAASPAPPPRRSVLARTATGLGWIVGWRMATRTLGLCNTLIVVRLLAPGDFGLVALGTGFALAVEALSALGVEDAMVRAHAPTPAMYDTAFTMNALRSLLTAAVVAAVAVPIGHFFAEPRLANVLFALAAGTVVQSASSIGVIDFRRDMEFHKEFQLQLLPRIITMLVTVGSALIWHSYWALVAGILSGRVARVAFSYRMHPYRPRPTLRAWRELIGFSFWSWAIGMIGLVRDRMDTFVIGRVMTATDVGIYSIGEEMAALPTTELVSPLCRACFSGFTAARRAADGMAETYVRAVSTTFLLTLPAGLGVSLVASPLVMLAVGRSWAAAVPVIQLLGVMGAVGVFGYVAAVLLSVHAMLRSQFTISACGVLVRLLILIPLVSHFGVVGAAVGSLIGATIEHGTLVALAFRRFALSYRAVLRQIWRILLAAAAMVAVVYAAGLGWHHATGSSAALTRELLLASTLGAVTYGLSLLLLWTVCGRPAGAEADLLTALRGLTRYLASRVALRRRVALQLAGANDEAR